LRSRGCRIHCGPGASVIEIQANQFTAMLDYPVFQRSKGETK
jgi:hypothetical protein